jgi:hypothetical protein
MNTGARPGAHRSRAPVPDPVSASMAQRWRSGAAKALERQDAALVQASPLAA